VREAEAVGKRQPQAAMPFATPVILRSTEASLQYSALGGSAPYQACDYMPTSAENIRGDSRDSRARIHFFRYGLR